MSMGKTVLTNGAAKASTETKSEQSALETLEAIRKEVRGIIRELKVESDEWHDEGFENNDAVAVGMSKGIKLAIRVTKERLGKYMETD